jgi:hypothetical protein
VIGGAVPSPYYIGCRVEALYDDGVWYDGVLDAGPEVRDGEKIDQEFLSVQYP